MAIHQFNIDAFQHRSLISKALFDRPHLYLHYSMKHAERYFAALSAIDREEFGHLDAPAKAALVLNRAASAIVRAFEDSPALYGCAPAIEIGPGRLKLTFTVMHDTALLERSVLLGLCERKTNHTKMLLLSPGATLQLWQKIKTEINPSGPSRARPMTMAAGGGRV